MRVAVTGASGLIGSALVESLRSDGHDVVRLVRRTARTADEASWDPGAGNVDRAALEGTDAVVHLAGAGLGDHRWSGEYKQVIRSSRVEGTTLLSEALADLDQPPRVLVSASGINYYGDRGDTVVDESIPRGEGFLADVCGQWEAATAAAAQAGIRVACMRSGIVLAQGGALGRMLSIFRLGLGGPLGTGRQWWSWIALPDHIAAVRRLIDDDSISGGANLTSPEPVRNAELTRALGRALHRPAVLPVPAFALRIALGEFADEGLLASVRGVPGRLAESGFSFRYPRVEETLGALL